LRKPAAILVLAALCLPLSARDASAEIGRILTKRERLAASRAAGDHARPSEELYRGLHERFLSEDYASAERTADEYLAVAPGAPHADDVRYLRALCLSRLGRAGEAREALRGIEASSTSDELRAAVSASTARTYDAAGDRDAAYRAYKDTLRRYPRGEDVPLVLSRLTELASENGLAAEEVFYRERLAREFPGMSVPASIRPAPLGFGAVEERAVYSVQVGSFSNARNARALIGRLKRAGYEAYGSDETVSGRALHRVRVGRFAGRQDALAEEARLRHDGYSTRLIP